MGDTGVDFRSQGGSRGSTLPAKTILSRAVRDHDQGLAQRILELEAWRTDYPQVFVDLTALEASSPEVGLDIARSGLAAATDEMCFVSSDQDQPLRDALVVREPELGTVTVSGTAAPPNRLEVPYEGRVLSDDALLRQLDRWVRDGITEPSFAEAVGAVAREPGWLDLRDRTFALIGAASQMGPYPQLMRWGATVAAVDLARPGVWYRLAGAAADGAGRLLAPSRAGDDARIETCGANLLTEVGPVARWLETAPGPLTLGNYSYANGGLFVRLSVAVDLVITQLQRTRGDLSLAYLASPADVFTVPMSAVEMSRHRARPLSPEGALGRAIRSTTRGDVLRPNYPDGSVIETATGPYGLLNAIIGVQGPNYCVAKRLQRWRMAVARDEGLVTSVHVAPPSRTASVHHNPAMLKRQLDTARLGIETFDAATTEALAAAVLVHDLRNPLSPANPDSALAHPLDSFHFAANPGGRWRIPFDIESSLPAVEMAVSAASRLAAMPSGLLRRFRATELDQDQTSF